MKIEIDLQAFFGEKEKPHVIVFDVDRNFGDGEEWEIRSAVWKDGGRELSTFLKRFRTIIYRRALEAEARGERIEDNTKVRVHRVGDLIFNNRVGIVSDIDLREVLPVVVDFNDGLQGSAELGFFHFSELEILVPEEEESQTKVCATKEGKES